MSTAITTTQREQLAAAERELLPDTQTLRDLLKVSEVLHKSGMLPNTITNAEAAFAVALKARELGIPPMAGFAGISIIMGKPTCGSELMLALIYRDHGDDAIRVVDTDAHHCTIDYRRRSWKSSQRHAFTIDDAKKAGLLDGRNKGTWAAWPANMIRARCISQVARMAFPDSIGGMYLIDEIGTNDSADDALLESTIVPEAAARPQADTAPVTTVVQTNGHAVDANTGEVIDTSLPDPAKATKKVHPVRQEIIDTLERLHRIAPAYAAPPEAKNVEEGKQQAERLKWDLVAIDGFAAEYNRQCARLRELDPSAEIEPLGGTVEAIKAQAEEMAHAVQLLETAKDARGEDDLGELPI